MIISIMVLASAGFIISLYAYFVERKVMADASYKPACDLSDRISCTKPLTSEYSKLFFVSNTVAGMIFYAIVAGASFFDAIFLLQLLAVIGILTSAILGYLLYVKIKAICLLCTSLYIINLLLFLISFNILKI